MSVSWIPSKSEKKQMDKIRMSMLKITNPDDPCSTCKLPSWDCVCKNCECRACYCYGPNTVFGYEPSHKKIQPTPEPESVPEPVIIDLTMETEDDSNRKRKRDVSDLEDPLEDKEYWIDSAVAEAFSQPVPYVPCYNGRDASSIRREFTPEEATYWAKVASYTDYPWVLAKDTKPMSFPYAVENIYTHQPTGVSEEMGPRPAFVCDRFYYKSRTGMAYPVLGYHWRGAIKTGSHSKGKGCVSFGHIIIADKHSNACRVLVSLCDRIYKIDPGFYFEKFTRHLVNWDRFDSDLDAFADMAAFTSDEDLIEEVVENFFDSEFPLLESFSSLAFHTRLRVLKKRGITMDLKAILDDLGAVTVNTTWCGFDHLELDFNFETECRIPLTLTKPSS